MDNLRIEPTIPRQQLTLTDAVAIIIGIVIGAGIFRTPSIVAANTSGSVMFMMAWVFGGVISLAGALCYAELTTTYPNTGGDYHFIRKAYGKSLAFLFAWARMSVIQTGSIALLSYIFGDYCAQIYPIGQHSSVIYASIVVILLTVINIAGIRLGTGTQKLLTLAEVAGVVLVIIAGLFFLPSGSVETGEAISTNSSGNFTGLAMVFVLLSFGGWSEAAYISAELKEGSNRMAKALVSSLIIITIIYVLLNLSYLNALGHEGMSKSEAVGVDLMKLTWGTTGAWLIGILVAVSALTSANATIFTGARTNYAMGNDFRIFSILGKWNNNSNGPVNALLAQAVIALALISFGLITRSGFETIIEYTAPVFWFFFLISGLALFVLRKKDPQAARPFKVPLYPLTPIVFCSSSAYLLYSSLAYTGIGALVGVGVLLVGFILLRFSNRSRGSS